MLPFQPDPFIRMAQGMRPMEDTMSAFLCHGVFARFPDLKVASVETGGWWVIPWLDHLADVYRKMPQMFQGNPIEQFLNCVYVSPFYEDDLGALIGAIGADHLLFGSDYPHPEGLAEPCSYVDYLPADLPQEDVEKVMGGNLANLMGVGVPA
jgi:predicted TIM-barrel fold metal-dependent hydrolase